MKTSLAIIILMFTHVLLSAQYDWEILNTDITEPLHDIEFLNDSVGFIYSYGTGNIYHTSDEGSTWTIIYKTDSIYFEQMQFINSEIGWICGEKGKVLKTNDSGMTWTDLSITVNAKNLLLYGMCFLNENIGYVSGAEMSEKKLIPKVYITGDGGNSWEEVYEDIPHMILNLEKKGNDLFATGNGFIIRMNIQINRWKYVFKDTLRITGQIRDLQFADEKFGLGTSFSGKILMTADGGNSFTYKEITANRLRNIAYLGEERWIACGDNNRDGDAVLHITGDNGGIWENINDFPDIHRINLTEKNIWIVGKKGFIAKKKRD